MVIEMGLHFGIDATYEHPMVQYNEFPGNRIIFIRHGSHDIVEDFVQGYREI